MVLHSVNFENSGAYSCEVIADITFHTLIQTKNMLVIGEKNTLSFDFLQYVARVQFCIKGL